MSEQLTQPFLLELGDGVVAGEFPCLHLGEVQLAVLVLPPTVVGEQLHGDVGEKLGDRQVQVLERDVDTDALESVCDRIDHARCGQISRERLDGGVELVERDDGAGVEVSLAETTPGQRLGGVDGDIRLGIDEDVTVLTVGRERLVDQVDVDVNRFSEQRVRHGCRLLRIGRIYFQLKAKDYYSTNNSKVNNRI